MAPSYPLRCCTQNRSHIRDTCFESTGFPGWSSSTEPANIPIRYTSSVRRTSLLMGLLVLWVQELQTGCEQNLRSNPFQHLYRTIRDLLKCMYFPGTGLAVQKTTCCISRTWNRASFQHMLTPPFLSSAAHHSASSHPLRCFNSQPVLGRLADAHIMG
jgi:hypothetical protein